MMVSMIMTVTTRMLAVVKMMATARDTRALSVVGVSDPQSRASASSFSVAGDKEIRRLLFCIAEEFPLVEYKRRWEFHVVLKVCSSWVLANIDWWFSIAARLLQINSIRHPPIGKFALNTISHGKLQLGHIWPFAPNHTINYSPLMVQGWRAKTNFLSDSHTCTLTILTV